MNANSFNQKSCLLNFTVAHIVIESCGFILFNRDSEKDPEAKTLEASSANNKDSAHADA